MRTHELTFDTSDRRILDVTGDVSEVARDHGGDGLLHLFLPHATAGLALLETGAGSEPDLEEAIERLLPRDDRYRHSHGPTGHGADHLLPAFIAPTMTLLVRGGALRLGTWQSVVIVDTNASNDRRELWATFLPG